MVRAGKHKGALRALHAIFVQLRTLAYEHADHERLAEALDDAELLPMLMASDDDQTERFRDTLAALAERDRGFSLALQYFDDDAIGQG